MNSLISYGGVVCVNTSMFNILLNRNRQPKLSNSSSNNKEGSKSKGHLIPLYDMDFCMSIICVLYY